ncbi:helix-turn-helix transcriptional regulator [Cognatiyoonia sp. IB215182]|uniref:helix-turn-helix transcriptional regulator n=1 Tax=Cognatiyoonia sp. IB215182 TaxID=3097353 RepID=UPI002A109D45|nr:helix-turn-helix transcriptional regulator [Cognatiyoonia sp. IB215182]MDX8350947.1 helix-turn-helix transcriptional regulator [Cognatiyoonia sp. IB215182]
MLVIVCIQMLCAFFFLSQILGSVFGLAPFSWQVHELIELGAALGLLLGVGLGWIVLRRTMARNIVVEDQLRVASGAFMDVMEEKFTLWELTPAERDVALFAIKGMSTQEIAALREVSEGTIKAQTNAIYRKANVSGRTQLLSLFIDDLMADAASS